MLLYGQIQTHIKDICQGEQTQTRVLGVTVYDAALTRVKNNRWMVKFSASEAKLSRRENGNVWVQNVHI